MRTTFRRLGFLVASAAVCAAVHAQDTAQIQKLTSVLQEVRTQRLMPLSTPPQFDWARIQNGYAFGAAHGKTIQTTLATSSLVSTFASKDIEPVLVYTGRLVTDFNRRMDETGAWVNEILAPPKDKTTFVKKNYKRSVDLGLMHLDLSQAAKIKWNPKVRVPVNKQAFAFVLYSFAWQPVETMLATHEIDLVKDAKAIDDWLYLWHVLGYGMGEDARLLPQGVQQTKLIVQLLRAHQYPGAGEEIPHEVRTLLRNEMSYLYFKQDNGLPIDDPTKKAIRKALAEQISYSPGLSKALGLGSDPFKGLEELDRTID